MSNLQVLRNQVAEALADKPSAQEIEKTPVKTIADGQSRMDAKKSRSSVAQSIRMRQKGQPNRSYSVAAIDMAKARLG